MKFTFLIIQELYLSEFTMLYFNATFIPSKSLALQEQKAYCFEIKGCIPYVCLLFIFVRF